MFNPTYLAVSGHGVWYLRWPIPRRLHPKRRATTVKVSLGTRDPKQALMLSRHLGYGAQLVVAHGTVCGMKFEEIRALLAEHFRQRLTIAKRDIAANGRLSRSDKDIFRNTADLAHEALSEGWSLIPTEPDNKWMDRLVERYGLQVHPGTKEYENIRTEAIRAHRDYCNALLSHDASLDHYDFAEEATEPSTKVNRQQSVISVTLKELASRFTSERNLGNQWVSKTQMERADQIALLTEILGEDKDVQTISTTDAQRVKDTLVRYPKNRRMGCTRFR